MVLIVNNEAYNVQGGNLLNILLEVGAFVDAPCAGKGRCGKCRVNAGGALSAPTPSEQRLLSANELAGGVRLACETTVLGDAAVTLLTHGDINAQEDGAVLDYAVDMSFLPSKPISMAVDIGTTTVVAYFDDISTGKHLYTASGINGQRVYGADVISRIGACIDNPEALLAQQKIIIAQLNRYINDFTLATGFLPASIGRVVIVGNTTMQHLLCALNPAGIASAPFTPSSLFGYKQSAAELCLCVECEVYHAPSISAYVGADITAGLFASGAAEGTKAVLYIDIGTNGEMALASGESLVCCSTAAGPAFEGAHIKRGVGGVAGAIAEVYAEDNMLKTKTIGGLPPIGICGSGIIDAAAAVLSAGGIDETGRILDIDEAEGFITAYINEADSEILLDKASGIAFTQQDIREVQLAKAAIAAGVNTLLHAQGLTYTDIDKLYIAGGFGAHINKSSACVIGLLPEALEDKIIFIGNAAGMGAQRVALTANGTAEIEKIAARAKYIELSGHAFFQDDYIEQMMFCVE